MRNGLTPHETAVALLHADLLPIPLHPPGVTIQTRDGPNWPSRNQVFGRFGGRLSKSSSLFLSGWAKRDIRWIMAMVIHAPLPSGLRS